MNPKIQPLIDELDKFLTRYEQIRQRNDFHNQFFPDSLAIEFVVRGLAAIERIAGRDSQYLIQTCKHLDQMDRLQYDAFGYKVEVVATTVKSLRDAVAAGYLISLQEMIHATVFSDFLDMATATYLLDEGFKDPAAVLIGGVLESHLRQLCQKHGIATEYQDNKDNSHPKKLDKMNADLVVSGKIDGLTQKQITAWAHLRNSAAHGRYEDYSEQQVRLMLSSIKKFMRQFPA